MKVNARIAFLPTTTMKQPAFILIWTYSLSWGKIDNNYGGCKQNDNKKIGKLSFKFRWEAWYDVEYCSE